MYLANTFQEYATLALVLFVGVVGFLIGTGQAGLLIAPREYWASSPLEIFGKKFKVGCTTSLLLMYLVIQLLGDWLK